MIIASHELDRAEGVVVNPIPYPAELRRDPPVTRDDLTYVEYTTLLAQGVYVMGPDEGWWG